MLARAVGPERARRAPGYVYQLVQPRPGAGLHPLAAVAARERLDRARPGIEHDVEAPRLRLEHPPAVLRGVRVTGAPADRQVAGAGTAPRRHGPGPVRRVDAGPPAS